MEPIASRRLEGRVALVTGGASGLGKAIARRLAADGAVVVITDVQSDLGRSTAAECALAFIEQNVCDEAQWARVIEEIERRFGHLHILVNNAGVLGPKDACTPETTRLVDWQRIFAVNVEGVFLGCRAAIPAMRRAGGGAIVNVSSVAGLMATPGGTAYGASKAAVRQLTKSVAQYCAQEKLNIRCNSVHPGDVWTPLWERRVHELARLRAVSVEEIIEEAKAATPMGDLSRPEDVAATVSFLVSEDARRTTGAALMVDGGMVDCDTFHMSRLAAAGRHAKS